MNDHSSQVKLEKLIAHGYKSVWSPAHDVDWNAGASELEKLSSEELEALRSVLSLVYYSDAQGKQILETLVRGLEKQRKTSAEQIKFSETVTEFFYQQMQDEERHTQGIMLLFDRLKIQPEAKAFTHKFYSKILLSEGHFEVKLILIYWYIEILAKWIFSELKTRFPQTCVDSLFTRIIRDEARHVGFGEIYIPEKMSSGSSLDYGKMATAYYSTAVALPGLYRFSHYAKAARKLGLSNAHMFHGGMGEIMSKVRKLPEGRGVLDLEKASEWISTFI